MMKRLLITAALAAASVPALAADVGVSINIGDPGYYGRLDIGYPQPQVIHRRPIAVEQVPRGRAPVYLRVPPGHAKDWREHCGQYNACNERVYFVRDSWYQHEYAPRYRQHGRDRWEERREERRDGDYGPGRDR
jgi:hypothetical protein